MVVYPSGAHHGNGAITNAQGKVWPLELLLDPVSTCKDIIPYNYLPVYLYLCIIHALISLTIMLRG